MIIHSELFETEVSEFLAYGYFQTCNVSRFTYRRSGGQIEVDAVASSFRTWQRQVIGTRSVLILYDPLWWEIIDSLDRLTRKHSGTKDISRSILHAVHSCIETSWR